MYHYFIHGMQQDESFNDGRKELQSKVTKESSKMRDWDANTKCIQKCRLLLSLNATGGNSWITMFHTFKKKSMDMYVKCTEKHVSGYDYLKMIASESLHFEKLH